MSFEKIPNEEQPQPRLEIPTPPRLPPGYRAPNGNEQPQPEPGKRGVFETNINGDIDIGSIKPPEEGEDTPE